MPAPWIGLGDQHTLQGRGERYWGIAMPFSRHLHDEIVNNGLCAVASRLAPGLVVVAVCSAESLEEKSKLGGGRGGRVSSHRTGMLSRGAPGPLGGQSSHRIFC